MPETESTDTTQESTAVKPEGSTPPWGSGEEFNPELAWSRIQKQARDIDSLRLRLNEAEPKVAEYDRLAEASKSELDKAQEAAQSNAQRAQALLDRAVNAEIRALATGFADPEDAAAFLSSKKYADDDGDVDTAAIKADLDDLLTRKPHLGAADPTTGRRAPRPDPSQGSGANGKTPISPAGEFASIIQAQLSRTQ